MTERTQIKPEDIREGDLIRAEWGADEAHEYRAGWDGQRYSIRSNHYLLDRPKPAVELPSEPTLGWVTGTDMHRKSVVNTLGSWCLGAGGELLNRTENTWPEHPGSLHLTAHSVASFTPAVAVPKDALETLREYAANSEHSLLLADFFSAIDAANGGDGR